jgi:hypothetical protein
MGVVSFSPGHFTLGTEPGTDCMEGWVGSRASLDAVHKRNISCLFRESNPGRPANHSRLWAFDVTLMNLEKGKKWKSRSNVYRKTCLFLLSKMSLIIIQGIMSESRNHLEFMQFFFQYYRKQTSEQNKINYIHFFVTNKNTVLSSK